ncbi:MAG: DUF1156 domain-containing protein [Sandaracinaceae bacterium]|nr:DUF1156 domain-containing protein [Sandaracinaceae bacterium]
MLKGVSAGAVTRRKLAEVALPLDAINDAAAREKHLRIGHPCSLHIWWSRKPLAACRALVFAQMVDDPSSRPDLFPTEEAQARERARLFELLSQLSRWESRDDERVLSQAWSEIRRAAGGDPPPVLDPFCGGGSVPLEAARLGVGAEAGDLNPLAALLTRALAELPGRFADVPSVAPQAQREMGAEGGGLSADVRHYARWIHERAAEKLAPLYPAMRTPHGLLAPHAWLWARTVPCPNPGCGAETPLASKFLLATGPRRKGGPAGKTWAQPVVEGTRIRYEVRQGKGTPPAATVGRGGARCLVCGGAIPLEQVRAAGLAGHLGAHLLAIAVDTPDGRIFVDADAEQEERALGVVPEWAPETDLPEQALGFRIQRYGLRQHRDLFTPRQLAALAVFADLAKEVRPRIEEDARRVLLRDDDRPVRAGGSGPKAYAEAVSVFLALALGKLTDYASTLCSWMPGQAKLGHTFVRQALAMSWDYAEGHPLAESTGGYLRQADLIARVLDDATVRSRAARVLQHDAKQPHPGVTRCVVITDPPYYDNIGYADLSDYFYVWLRPILRDVYPDLFRTVLTPKEDELVAAAERFRGDRGKAKTFFERGLGEAFARMRDVQHPDYPLSVFYAFKQSETSEEGVASTGWESMLQALLEAGFSVTGTWPMRTESTSRLRNLGSNALASSIALICRPRPDDAPRATRAEFLSALRAEFPGAMKRLQQGHVAPVDLAQAAIGPGIALFSHYREVLEADGSSMTVRSALALINQLLDEHLSAHEGDLDAASRFAVTWYETYGFDAAPFGDAETLAKARVVTVASVADLGIVTASGGKVQLVPRAELRRDRPLADQAPAWLGLQRLAYALDVEGEREAAALLQSIGSLRPTVRALAYRLYASADRKKWNDEARTYNALVVAWPELERLAAAELGAPAQQSLPTGSDDSAIEDG